MESWLHHETNKNVARKVTPPNVHPCPHSYYSIGALWNELL